MLIVPIHTRTLETGSDLASELRKTPIEQGDIIVISSKAVATAEGAAIDLSTIQPSTQAREFAKKTGQQPAFAEAVMREATRMNGKVVGTCPGALLTMLRPKGMKGILLCPNAGLDLSNVPSGWTVGWPKNPVESARRLQKTLGAPVIITDSACPPTRRGVTAFALCCAGLNPVRDERGNKDLFGTQLRITQEAVADQLAVAANAVMGNAAQSAPAAIVRDHGFALSDFCGWVDGIEPSDDIFRDVLVLRSPA